MYKGINVFQSVADNYTDPKSSNTSQTYGDVGIADQQKEGKNNLGTIAYNCTHIF